MRRMPSCRPHCLCGATDSAPDYESGGWGFNSSGDTLPETRAGPGPRRPADTPQCQSGRAARPAGADRTRYTGCPLIPSDGVSESSRTVPSVTTARISASCSGCRRRTCLGSSGGQSARLVSGMPPVRLRLGARLTKVQAPVAQRIARPVSTRLVGGSNPPGSAHGTIQHHNRAHWRNRQRIPLWTGRFEVRPLGGQRGSTTGATSSDGQSSGFLIRVVRGSNPW